MQPADGGFYASGDDIPFDVDVADTEETVDCSQVVVQEGLGHDIHVHPNLSVNGCEGTIRTAASGDHGPDANTYGVLIASYRDGGNNDGANASLSGSDTVILQPKLRQAEHATNRQGVGYTGYDDKSGTRPGGGGLITGMGAGDWVMFDPMSLVNMTDVSITYSGGPQAGAAVEVRAGAADGPVVATVPLDGGTQGQYFYETVTAEISARAPPGGRPLYFVYTGNGEMNFDEFRVDGQGVAGNTSPVIDSATATPSDGLAPLDVDFAAEATDPDGDAITYAWDFGVEGTDVDTADTATASWTYPEPGPYTATVTVEDSTGKTTSKAVPVTVRQPCATAPTPDEGYELLFDGTDTSAWKQSGPGGFTVENCELTSFGGLGLFRTASGSWRTTPSSCSSSSRTRATTRVSSPASPTPVTTRSTPSTRATRSRSRRSSRATSRRRPARCTTSTARTSPTRIRSASGTTTRSGSSARPTR